MWGEIIIIEKIVEKLNELLQIKVYNKKFLIVY